MTLTPRQTKSFWSRVSPGQGDECWQWNGKIDRLGYGAWSYWVSEEKKVRHLKAHQQIYALLVGPVPDGLELDHTCRNRACVNPAHLEPVTHAENMRRASEAKTHCKRGHEFTPENTRLYKTGHKHVKTDRLHRSCRACERERAK